MKKTLVNLQDIEGWPLIGNRKVWVVPVGLPFSGVTTLADRLEENLRFQRYNAEVMDAIRAQGRVLRSDIFGYFPSLTEAEWETILGPLREPVKRGASIVIDDSHVEWIDRELVTSIANWWGYVVVRVHLNTPPNICLKRMLEWERNNPQRSPMDQRRIAKVATRLDNGRNWPSRSEGHWLVLDNLDPFDDLFELTMI